MIYEYATTSWPIANGCSPNMPCAPSCWAKNTVNRLAHAKDLGVRAAHEGLVESFLIPGYKRNCPSVVVSSTELRWTGVTRLNEAHLTDPLRWRKPRRIAVAYHGDLFRLPFEQIDRVFAVMALAPQHTFLALTKAAREMREYLTYHFRVVSPGPRERVFSIVQKMPGYDPEHSKWMRLAVHAFDVVPLPNLYLGVSACNQAEADERIPLLLQTPAAVRWVSLEPLVGPVDLTAVPRLDLAGVEPGTPLLHWVVLGGESGPDARPMHPDWARSLRNQCQAADVPFFFKQWGEWIEFRQSGLIQHPAHIPTVEVEQHSAPNQCRRITLCRVGKRAAGRLLDGREHTEMPEVLR